jgi:hypothetical protein
MSQKEKNMVMIGAGQINDTINEMPPSREQSNNKATERQRTK